jgi:hypothetical protein
LTATGFGSSLEYTNRLFSLPCSTRCPGFELAVPEQGPAPFTAKEKHVKRKIGKKLSLSKETLRSMDEMSLQGVAGGITQTNVCTVCTACASCFDTCMLNTEGVCCV